MNTDKFEFKDISGRQYGCKLDGGHMYLFIKEHNGWRKLKKLDTASLNSYRELAERQLNTTT